MRLIQVKHRIGNLSLDKYGVEVDRERAVLPAIVIATQKSYPDRITVIGIGWWKWGARLILHTRKSPGRHVSQ